MLRFPFKKWSFRYRCTRNCSITCTVVAVLWVFPVFWAQLYAQMVKTLHSGYDVRPFSRTGLTYLDSGLRHSAGGAAIGLGSAACWEVLAGVYAGAGALPHVILLNHYILACICLVMQSVLDWTKVGMSYQQAKRWKTAFLLIIKILFVYLQPQKWV